MKVYVNENCIGCGLCESICPKVFELNENGLAQAIDSEIDKEDETATLEALNGCPVGAIEEVKII